MGKRTPWTVGSGSDSQPPVNHLPVCPPSQRPRSSQPHTALHPQDPREHVAEEKGLLAGCAAEGTNSQEQAHNSNMGRRQKDLGAEERGRTHRENSDDVSNTTNSQKRIQPRPQGEGGPGHRLNRAPGKENLQEGSGAAGTKRPRGPGLRSPTRRRSEGTRLNAG